jgi:hypothetical protein
MTLTQWLWQPLPDSLPPPRQRKLRALRTVGSRIAVQTELARLSLQQQTSRLVRRGAVQAIVRNAYQATVAEQDREHRPPDAFTRTWREHLVALLVPEVAQLNGWGPITVVDDTLAWNLFELASQARHEAIDSAKATASETVDRRESVATVEFKVTADGEELGAVSYGVCDACRIGLLYKIGFPADWQFCGLGRLALGELEARHPEVIWYTAGQLVDARGFYDRYRRSSRSPWTTNHLPCEHFR